MSRKSYPAERDPYDAPTDIFADVASYNSAGPRHPLPDLQTPVDELEYTGFEPSTALPQALTEDIARAYIRGLASMRDALETEKFNQDSAWCKIEPVLYGQVEPHDKSAGHAVLKKLNSRAFSLSDQLDSRVCNYLAKTLFTQGTRGKEMEERLQRLGVSSKRRMHNGELDYVRFERRDKSVTLLDLCDATSQINGASYLRCLISSVHGIKPQYTQPAMFYIGSAIDRSAELAPSLAAEFSQLRDLYCATGLANATECLRRLIFRPHPPHAPPASRRVTHNNTINTACNGTLDLG